MDTRHRNTLLKYLPAQSIELVAGWIDKYPLSLTISRKRNSKMGDYRPPLRHPYHRISVNGDLHPYAFLVTLVHELAHLVTWEKYQRRVRPHGEQWKNQFRTMLNELSGKNIFTEDISSILKNFSTGKISYRTFNLEFEKKIHGLNPGNKGCILEDIPVDTVFSIHNGRTFIKKEKLRTRFRCQDVKNGRYYLISPQVMVTLKEDQG